LDAIAIISNAAPAFLAMVWIAFAGLAGWQAARLALSRSRSITAWSIATILCPPVWLLLFMLPRRDGRALSRSAACAAARDRASQDERGTLAGTTPVCRYGEPP